MKPWKFVMILLVTLGTASFGDFAVKPYLLDVTENSAVVAFHLHEPSSAKVRVFDPDDGVKEFFSHDKVKSHFITVTGLKEGSICPYQVICGQGEIQTDEGDLSFQIKTAPRPGKSFTFAVYGDPRPGETQTHRNHKGVIDQILQHEPAFCLILGDMVDDGTKPEFWEDFFQIESPVLRRSAAYTVMGDNDYAGGDGLYATYFPEMAKGYYTFEWGGVQFFALRTWDTRGQQPRTEIDSESEQIRWLESELAKEQVQKAPFRVVFLHDPVYISRGQSSEILRRVWEPLFQKYKVDVVFASWHLYERSSHKDITYIISGGSGAELIWMNQNPSFPSQAEARRHHFCRVDVDSDTMTIRAIADDGTVLDSITLTPRSQSVESTRNVSRVANLLSKEIHINKEAAGPALPLRLFSYDCTYCRKLLRHDLPRLAKKNNVALEVFYFDLGLDGSYGAFLNAEAEFDRQGADVPAIFIGRNVFGGELEIDAGLDKEIALFRNDPQRYLEQAIVPFSQSHDTATMAEGKFEALTVGIVAGAGLLDGINPCAFTTIIFLISYLSLVGVSRKQMFYTGGVFTLSVFLTYFMIGLAFFNFFKLVLRNPTVVVGVNILLLIIVVLLAVFSCIDWVRCLKGNARDITLQLPGFLKESIRARIRDFAKNKPAILGASFILGVVIAGTELACTGQVYIPIVTMISEPSLRVRAVSYLLLYNIAFILPLVGVFLLATFGVTSDRMGRFFTRHIAVVKMAFVLLFAVMALMIVHNLRWL